MGPIDGGCQHPTATAARQELSESNLPAMGAGPTWFCPQPHFKSRQLVDSLLSWFSHSKVPLCVDDLVNMLAEFMLLQFDREIEDGSIDEVAELLMFMYEDILLGHLEII
ncbi:unnamed protein product [Spirodela intermedia]|uniref:Uncharacterized protein n=1 Tax=Spirodela intermedia TaxID=51605 RepID=A0A7I8I8I8_SPIIN|nr:unnamed protein product [Spirodela intermedia]CAA6653794.1 unnamed protein product [Spirodela intermedia]